MGKEPTRLTISSCDADWPWPDSAGALLPDLGPDAEYTVDIVIDYDRHGVSVDVEVAGRVVEITDSDHDALCRAVVDHVGRGWLL